MADDERDPQLAHRLEVEPLDDVTRRRLVTRALRESEPEASPADATAASAPNRSGAWRWLAVAAVVVVVLVIGLAVLAQSGGDGGEQASREKSRASALAPGSFDQALSVAPDVGDYGNLDEPANRVALRRALEQPAKAQAPAAAAPEAGDAAGTSAESLPTTPAGCARGVVGRIVARGRGTLDGRPVTVVLVETSNGARSIDALFDDTCDVRQLEVPAR